MSEQPTNSMPPAITYDPFWDVVTIDGIKFARGLFATFASAPIGSGPFRIIARADGLVTLQTVAEDKLAAIPSHLYWLIGKGRTRPAEPLFAVQLIDPESGIAIAEAEADRLADAIDVVVKQLTTCHRPEGER